MSDELKLDENESGMQIGQKLRNTENGGPASKKANISETDTMFIIIDLQDEGKSHDSVQLKMQSLATIEDLKAKILLKFYIPIEDQQLFDKDNRRVDLLVGQLNQVGIEDRCVLVLKHRLLANWSAYLKEVEEIKRLTTSGATSKRSNIAIRGLEQLSPLDGSDFFKTYPNLVEKRRKIDGEINYLVHNTEKYLKRSVEKYFEPDKVEFVNKPKAAGIQLGFFVNVTDKSSDLCRKYYVKTVGIQPRAEVAPKEKLEIDLIELFVYQLLSLIGFGASEVHLVPDKTNNDCVYLATSLIEGFRTASGYSVDELLTDSNASKKKTVISKEVQNQLNIIASILRLTDLHENASNYGVVERRPTNEERQAGADDPVQVLKIVDFRVDVARGPRFPKTTPKTSLKSYFDKWELKQKIAEAKQLIMGNKAIKNNSNLNTPQFEFYITQIEAFLKTIQ